MKIKAQVDSVNQHFNTGSAKSSLQVGIDTGGTFTDFLVCDEKHWRIHKVLSDPEDPARAILQGLRELGIDTEQNFYLAHGTTVATNTVLEGTGAVCAYITNRGFADVLRLGRQARKELYNLRPPPEPVPVAEELCFETGGRLSANGEILEPLTDEDLRTLCEQIKAAKVEAVAINLLFSWRDSDAERRIEAALPKELFISRSSQVLPEIREYERGMATWLNSYVGPGVGHYMGRLHTALPNACLDIMQSHGGTLPGHLAAPNAVRLLLSGPAAGLAAALEIGKRAGTERILSLDMGGTSTDVALIDGHIGLSSDGEIGGFPVATPMVDMHTIGAGGGSLAYQDEGGLLRVGPRSAGSRPGPACYGHAGTHATVTDAHVALGWIPAEARLAGSLALDVEAAHAAVRRLADALNLDPLETARGIVRVANENMAQALRVVSIQHGHNPRDFTLMAFGGAGGLHLCALAEALDINRAIVPTYSGAFSALGLLLAPQSRELTQSLGHPLQELDDASVAQHFAQLQRRAHAELDVPESPLWEEQRNLDLRYVGQSASLRLPWISVKQAGEDFHAQHRKQYGHALDVPIELVTLRLSLTQHSPTAPLPDAQERPPAAPQYHASVEGREVPIYRRDQLALGQSIAGPAIILEDTATTRISKHWCAELDSCANIQLVRSP